MRTLISKWNSRQVDDSPPVHTRPRQDDISVYYWVADQMSVPPLPCTWCYWVRRLQHGGGRKGKPTANTQSSYCGCERGYRSVGGIAPWTGFANRRKVGHTTKNTPPPPKIDQEWPRPHFVFYFVTLTSYSSLHHNFVNDGVWWRVLANTQTKKIYVWTVNVFSPQKNEPFWHILLAVCSLTLLKPIRKKKEVFKQEIHRFSWAGKT